MVRRLIKRFGKHLKSKPQNAEIDLAEKTNRIPCVVSCGVRGRTPYAITTSQVISLLTTGETRGNFFP